MTGPMTVSTKTGDGRLAAYKQNQVLGSSPEQLVVLLYEHLLANLRRAGMQIDVRDYEGKSASMQKALDIIFELLSSLDRDAGGELAERLSALYVYFINEIGAISRNLDRARLEQLIVMIAGLHESMAQAARRTAQERAGR